MIAFAIVFSGFLIYLAAAPTTYRTTAMIAVEYAPEAANAQPEPLEAARRLRESALDRELLAKLAREESKTATTEAWAAAASRIRGAFEVDSLDGRAFAVSFRDGEAARTERVCNLLADRVVARAPDALLAGRAREAAAEHDRDVDQLTAFMAKHPELLQEPSGGAQAPDAAQDTVLKALRSERAILDRQLALATAPSKSTRSDNPYGDAEPAAAPRLDTETVRRRLNEINGVILARQKALSAAAAPSAEKKIPAEVSAEWKRLLQKVKASDADPAGKAAAPKLKARVAKRAQFPDTPIEPNRTRLLTFAAFVSTVTGLVFALLRSVTPARHAQGKTSRSDGRPAPASERPRSRPSRPEGDGSSTARIDLGPGLAYAPTARDLAIHAGPVTPSPIKSAAPADAPISRRAIIEVNASPATPLLPAGSAEPAPTTQPIRFKATRTTQVLGSPLPAHMLEPPASIKSPDGLSPARASSAPPVKDTTGYSYVSSDSLPATNVDEGARPFEATTVSASDAPAKNPATNGGAQETGWTKAVTLTIHDAPPGWSHDPALVPAAQRALIDQTLQRALAGPVIVGLSGPAGASDVKSRVAAELAVGLAETRRARVLLMEGNLQRPAVHRWLRVSMPLAAGLSMQLNARADHSAMRPWAVLQCTPNLHALAEGVMRSPGLLLSQAFYDCVKELKTCYDVVLIDGPMMSDAVECRAFDSLMDALVLVAPKSLGPELIRAETIFTRPTLSQVLLPG